MDSKIPKKIQDTLYALESEILTISETDALKNILTAIEAIGTNLKALIKGKENKKEEKTELSKLWTVKEVATYFHVSTVTVYSWIHEGKLKTIATATNKIRIDQEAIDNYKDENAKYRSLYKSQKKKK